MQTPPHRARAVQSDIRRNNLRVIMGNVAERQPVSRTQLSLETGLTKPTVSTLVAELIAAGLVSKRKGSADRGVGRPATVLTVSGERIAAVGVEIDLDLISGCVMDLSGRLRIVKTAIKSSAYGSSEALLDELSKLVRELLAESSNSSLDVVGVGVALPGLVDPERGSLCSAPHLGVEDAPVVAHLSQTIEPDIPIVIDNNANFGAIAIQWQERPRAPKDFIHVMSGVGLGAGIVIDGELFRGAHGFASEFGHVVIDMHGPECICGSRGCLGAVISEALQWNGDADATGELWIKELIAALEAGNAAAHDSVRKAGEAFSAGVTSLVHLFDPSAIVLSGLLESLLPWIREPIESALRERSLGSRWRVIELRGAGLGRTAPAMGAAAQLLNGIVNDPFAWTSLSNSAALVRA